MKKTIIIILVVSLCFSLCACGKSAEAEKADELILAIGEVTENSGDAIVAAQTYYDKLTAEQKEEVENYDLLVKAQERYARVAAEMNIQAAYDEDNWGTVLELSKEYIASYPDEQFAKKAQEYKDEAIELIDKKTIAYLKAGDLENGKLLLEAIKDDVDGAVELLTEVEAHIAIAGDYFASQYTRKSGGQELPFNGTRESYKLTVAPFMSEAGEWQAQYTVEVPGIFNLAGSGCFTYTCIGIAETNSNAEKSPVATELNPQIDRYNTKVVKEDAIQFYATNGGYLVVHTMYRYNSYDYEEFSLVFVKP